ncbi:copper amine oxidase [Jimgerdemannia flammicorona]|uniref:Amine oxidase n=1 Tax=Jimgerdemannia flammicorona TaxID=994334 RepID=A0A433QB01_9FUNG|nr:copper amine oxidase [Jimgerdemannia flammicorona]
MNTPPLMAKPGSIIHWRAGFAKRSLWVTPYHDEQMFAAGFYVKQSYGAAGLDEWTKEKKNVEDEDVVIWHTFGVTQSIVLFRCSLCHYFCPFILVQCIPRVEDFPVMPPE